MQQKKTTERSNVVSVELSAVKIEQLNKQPILESFAMLSEDRKWLIHKTIVTDIKPASYYGKVLSIPTA